MWVILNKINQDPKKGEKFNFDQWTILVKNSQFLLKKSRKDILFTQTQLEFYLCMWRNLSVA